MYIVYIYSLYRYRKKCMNCLGTVANRHNYICSSSNFGDDIITGSHRFLNICLLYTHNIILHS